jgi:hypothetical protein
MIISNRVRKLGHTASGYMRIAVKKHESKTSPGGRTERRSYATVGQSIESNVPDIDEIPAPQYVARLFGDPAIGTARSMQRARQRWRRGGECDLRTHAWPPGQLFAWRGSSHGGAEAYSAALVETGYVRIAADPAVLRLFKTAGLTLAK